MPNKKATLWQRLKRRHILYNIVLIFLAIAGILVVAQVAMNIGTRHGSHRTVPDIKGMPFDRAMEAARDLELEIIVNDSLYVPAYDGGTILEQLPAGGVEVKAGRKIYVTINSFSQKKVRVPYVAGRSLRQAKNLLEVSGLGIERLVYVKDIATNYVIREMCRGKEVTPQSDIKIEQGSGITLYVGVKSDEGATTVPSLAGLSLERAKSRLWESGLNVGDVSFDSDIDLLERKVALVYSQSLPFGSSAALGSSVDLRLTLDLERVAKASSEAEAQAKTFVKESLSPEDAEHPERLLLDEMPQTDETQEQEQTPAPEQELQYDEFFE